MMLAASLCVSGYPSLQQLGYCPDFVQTLRPLLKDIKNKGNVLYAHTHTHIVSNGPFIQLVSAYACMHFV